MARSSFRVICNTVRIGHEYIEDYGDTLKRFKKIRNMPQMTTDVNVGRYSQLFVEDNGFYLREISTLETMTELCAISEVAISYLKNQSLPSRFIHEAYRRTKHWVQMKSDSHM